MGDTNDTPEQALTPVEQAEKRRADRKAAASAQRDEQRAQDLDAVNDLEIEHGDSNVGVIHVPFTPGLPTLVACKCPSPGLLKRFRSRVTPKHEKDHPDNAAAAEELAAACRIFPDPDTYKKMCDARPGIAAQLGGKAIELSTGKSDADLKG